MPILRTVSSNSNVGIPSMALSVRGDLHVLAGEEVLPESSWGCSGESGLSFCSWRKGGLFKAQKKKQSIKNQKKLQMKEVGANQARKYKDKNCD